MVKYWLPALLWATVIFITSSSVIHSKEFIHSVVHISDGRMNKHEFQNFWKSWWWVFVKGYHVFEYFLLTLLLYRASLIKKMSWTMRLCGVWIVAILYASSDEYHQTFVPTRGGKWTDVMIDCIGITLATLLIFAVGSLQNRKNLSSKPKIQSA